MPSSGLRPRRITAVIPYFGYARQDRKVAPRTPITSKLVADLITTAGADRVFTMDLHAGQIQGFFNIPVDHLYAAPVILDDMLQPLFKERVVVVSPDAGGTERARAFAKRLDAGLAIIDKRRSGPNVSEVMHIIGDVEDQTCIIVDDMIDTAGTLCQAANAHSRKAAPGKSMPTPPMPFSPGRLSSGSMRRRPQGSGGHQHDPGRRKVEGLSEIASPFRCRTAGGGDPPDSRRRIGQFSVRRDRDINCSVL